jgi:hypothetical protein
MILAFGSYLAEEASDVPSMGTATVEKSNELEGRITTSVSYSSDGSKIYYYSRIDKDYYFCSADKDGGNMKKIQRTALNWDDILLMYSNNHLVSKDGKHTVIAHTVSGNNFKGGGDDKPQTTIKVLAKEGDINFTPTRTFIISADFCGDVLYYIDTINPKDKTQGYTFFSWSKAEGSKELFKDDDLVAFTLKASPDSKKVAFQTLRIDWNARKLNTILNVYDLATKKIIKSAEYLSDDYFFDGPGMIFWGAESKNIYYNAHTESKSDFKSYQFNLEKKTSTVLKGLDKHAITAVLDKDHIAVLATEEPARSSKIVNLKENKHYIVGSKQYVVGGSGSDIVIHDGKRRKTYTAKISYDKEEKK